VRRRGTVLRLEALDDRCLLSTLFVTNTSDHGLGSLRQAILDANSAKGSLIDFSMLPKPGEQIIKLASALPALTANGVTIDGTTDLSSIVIDGQNAAINGLVIEGTACSVAGLSIVNCGNEGIVVTGNNDTVAGCLVGFDFDGTQGLGGDGTGILAVQVSGLTIQSCKVDYNVGDGIGIFNSSGVVTDSTQVEGNGWDGMSVRGSSQAATASFATRETNDTINANLGNGIRLINSSYNQIGILNDGNIIGNDGVVSNPVQGNGNDGILIESDPGQSSAHNSITSNHIASNQGNGIRLTGTGTSDNVLNDNFIGIYLIAPTEGSAYTAAVWGNNLDGVLIADGANTNFVGGPGLFLNGSTANGSGNIIVENLGAGIGLMGAGTEQNLVQGNLVGTNEAGTGNTMQVGNGTFPTGNKKGGVVIADGASQNVIGGIRGTAAQTGDGNLISGNLLAGVDIRDAGTSQNGLYDNFIGTSVTGTSPVPNLDGVVIRLGAADNFIGYGYPGAGTGLGNLISGNFLTGVAVDGAGTVDNVIQSNEIGTTFGGGGPLGNGWDGVLITNGARDNVVGGVNNLAKLSLPANTISGNGHNGVEISLAGTVHNVVAGNLIGTDSTGMKYVPNLLDGVLITSSAIGNFIGGNASAAGNIISGNHESGVVINPTANGNLVENNKIGASVSGESAVSNGQDGVDLLGNKNTVSHNLISGNIDNGVVVNGSNNTIQTNLIGTDVNGSSFLTNQLDGVVMNITNGPGGNTLGGTTAGEANIISGNLGNGVHVEGTGGANNVIEGNKIGTDMDGNAPLDNGLDGVFVDNATGYSVGGSVPLAGNLISGNLENGIEITGSSSHGIVVQGNKIGTDINGQTALANGLHGVSITAGANHNVIGGTGSNDGNLISGNGVDGVFIAGSFDVLGGANQTQDNHVLGNKIGTNLAGSHALPNQFQGVEIQTSNNNSVGGNVAGAGNLISGNRLNGILLTGGAHSNLVQGNLIGSDSTGDNALPNQLCGIVIDNATNNRIGGTPTNTSTPGNVISGNQYSGLVITGTASTSNFVQGNFIGTTAQGLARLGNGQDGIDIWNGASSNVIGGSGGVGLTHPGNYISGNTQDGVHIDGTGTHNNFVEGNDIGTYSSGLTGEGNGFNGVSVYDGAHQNFIGGPTPSSGNVIAYNREVGVAIGKNIGDSTTVSDPILHNSIYGNVGLGIDLGDDGVTPNNSPPPGPNNLLNTPVIESATYDSNTGTTEVRLVLNAAQSAHYIIELFANPTLGPQGHGDGQTFPAQVPVMTVNGTVTVDITLAGDLEGQYLSATTTDSSLDTSEFSKDYRVN